MAQAQATMDHKDAVSTDKAGLPAIGRAASESKVVSIPVERVTEPAPTSPPTAVVTEAAPAEGANPSRRKAKLFGVGLLLTLGASLPGIRWPTTMRHSHRAPRSPRR